MIGQIAFCVFAAFVAPAVSQCRGPIFSSGRPSFISLSNCGPAPLPLPVIQAPPEIYPAIEDPIIPLPSPPIPAPKTIAHKCVCTKTVVKPQVIQRYINVPKVQRYLKQSYTPVVENIPYQARPRCSEVVVPPVGVPRYAPRYLPPLPIVPPDC